MAIFDMKDRIEPNLFLVSRMVGDQALLLDPRQMKFNCSMRLVHLFGRKSSKKDILSQIF